MGAKRILPLLAQVEELAATVSEIKNITPKDRETLRGIVKRADGVREHFGVSQYLLNRAVAEKQDE